jgi:hypothetical protein
MFTESRQASLERHRNGLVMKPVSATAVPRVTAREAWATVEREYPVLPKVAVAATLALVTTEGHGEMAPDGSVTPKYNDRLTWVITLRDVEVLPLTGGPIHRPAARRMSGPSSPTT